jgi:trk system potassium uptake protein TrkH
VIAFRPVLLVVGILLITLAAAMVAPAAVDAVVANPDWQVFAASAAITLFIGLALVLSCRARRFRLNVRQAFVMTALSWLTITLFAALPFVFSNLGLSVTDSIFEAVSGITTTGSTVIIGLDTAPPGILLWRGLLQWLGGLGIIVMAISLMPMLGVGGMQMFRAEAFETGEKMLPRAAQISAALSLIYVGLTVLWTVLLYIAGMNWLEATVHAMTTIATGGFSTRDASVGGFASPTIDAIITIGMLAGSLPFLLYLRTLQGDRGILIRDSQVRWFFAIAAAGVAVMTIFVWFGLGLSLPEALRYGAFNVISVMTGTGYATSDYWQWGAFAGPMFFFIMFIGGCTGSTTCGIKIFRFQVLYAAADNQFRHLYQPHGVFVPYYNNRPIPDAVIGSVLSFFFVFGVCFAFLAVGLGMLGLDTVTAISSAATAISNVGPALGPIAGPAGTFQQFPHAAKWLLCAGMLLGRLELFTVLILFSPSFWRG